MSTTRLATILTILGIVLMAAAVFSPLYWRFPLLALAIAAAIKSDQLWVRSDEVRRTKDRGPRTSGTGQGEGT